MKRILRAISNFFARGIVDYACHLQEMDEMKAAYEHKLRKLKGES